MNTLKSGLAAALLFLILSPQVLAQDLKAQLTAFLHNDWLALVTRWW